MPSAKLNGFLWDPMATPSLSPRISIVTTCKGRLSHLRQTLPGFLAQSGTEVIVVDYDCPDCTAMVVAREFPLARVVAIGDAPQFNLARARNLGAAAAFGEWLAFLDADILVAPDFSQRSLPAVSEPGVFYSFFSPDEGLPQARGSCLVRKQDFDAIQGYDEVIAGYGGEDDDLYFRLGMRGLQRRSPDLDLILQVMKHDDSTRMRFYRHRSLVSDQRINSAYLLVKNSLLRQLGPTALPEPQRRRLYDLIREVVSDAAHSPTAPLHFTIELPEDPGFMPVVSWGCTRHIVFDLTPKQPPDAEGRGGDQAPPAP